MKKTIEVEHIFCDFCNKDMEKDEKMRLAESAFTCARCGKNFCVSCGQSFHSDDRFGVYFSLCDKCVEDLNLLKECKR